MSKMFGALAGAMVMVAAPALADPVVDGTKDADYTTSAQVVYSPAAPNSNFDAPTPLSDTASYTISLYAGADRVFGFLKADRDTNLPFANLYFDLNPSVGDGSDVIFGFGNGTATAYVAGGSGPGSSVALDGSQFSLFSNGTTIEFSLLNSLFTGPIPGLTYFEGQTFTAGSEPLTLRLSQSFGYSVAGGPLYGPNRLGAFTVGSGTAATPGVVAGVPEPAAWTLMILGFGAVGFAMRRRAAVRTSVSFA